MSDNFEMIVDSDVTIDDAGRVGKSVVAMLREHGLITGKANAKCVLDGKGYRPGPGISQAYKLGEDEAPFWELHTSGVESRVGRSFNQWALGPSCEGFVCPACEATFGPDDDELGSVLADAIEQWVEESGPALAACPRCHAEVPVTQWRCDPPLGFGNLSFVFWNWPPLNSPGWQIDILDLVRRLTGHTVILSHGHI
jgi:hypothetical protein